MTNKIVKNIFSKILQLLASIIPKDRKLIIFGAYSGRYFGDNSKALYLHLLKDNVDHLRLIWLSDDQSVIDEVRRLGGEAYKKRSLKGIWLSLMTDLVITSHTLSDVLLYPPVNGQPKELYLHHGTPLRKQIFPKEQRSFGIPHKCSLSRFKRITLTIATSSWAAEQQLNNIPVGEGRVKITGLPRNDTLFHLEDKDELKQRYGLGKFIIFYAPTFRREEATRFFPFRDQDIDEVSSFLKKREMTLILRPHHTDLNKQKRDLLWGEIEKNDDVFKIITILDHADANDLLKLTDCLITDYSSIHYDYLLVNKPVIYLPYDIDEYSQKWGGFNCNYERFTPGPKPKTQKEFLEWLDKFYRGSDQFAEARGKIRDIVHDYLDGNSSQRVYELMKKDIMHEKVGR